MVLRIPFPSGSVGSTPTSGTNQISRLGRGAAAVAAPFWPAIRVARSPAGLLDEVIESGDLHDPVPRWTGVGRDDELNEAVAGA